MELSIELKDSLRIESSSLPFGGSTETSKFPFFILDVAAVRANIGLRIFITRYKINMRIPIFIIPKTSPNNVRFCEFCPALCPNFVTNTSDESIKLAAIDSNCVFTDDCPIALKIALG
jgi:hypothetical protein